MPLSTPLPAAACYNARMHYRKPFYRWIYLAGLLSALHYAFTIYINSTFLAQYFPGSVVNLLYTAGALVTILVLVASSRLINKVGIYRFALVALAYEIVALLFLAFVRNPLVIVPVFVIHEALPLVITFALDVFLEGMVRDEHTTGTVRSNYLTAVNGAFVVSPIVVGALVDRWSYNLVYGLSAAFAVVLLLLIADNFAFVRPKGYREVDFLDSVRKFLPRRNLLNIFLSNFFLQCFYALMVIFAPLYLHETIGMPWTHIGIVFTAMLLPFVIFEAPLGRIFDKYRDEGPIMLAGFLIMAAATSSIFFIHSANVLLWAAVLFVSRVGAAFVEVGSDTAFFRHVGEQDAGFISIYRLTAPISYVLAPLAASFLALFMPFVWMFPIVGLFMLVGASVAYRVRS